MKTAKPLISFLTLIWTVEGQFYTRVPEGHFYNGNTLRADIAAEKRSIRLANADFMHYSDVALFDIEVGEAAKDYLEYKERGSLYLKDGVTPIPENENIDVSSCDPRSPLGVGDPVKQVMYEQRLSLTTSPYISEEIDPIEAETYESGWVLVNGKGDLNLDNQRPDLFTELITASPNKIIRVLCESCISSHTEVYYKRLTDIPVDLLTIIEEDWRSVDNTFNIDFQLFSSYEDAVNVANPWTYCSFDGVDQGFPGTCGPSGEVLDQWINMNKNLGQADVAIYVEDSDAPESALEIPDWVNALEAERTNNPEDTLNKEFCWHLPSVDSRRACWMACDQGENSPNLEALKLCLNLRLEGLEFKMTKYAEDSEIESDMMELPIMKDTHALGSDSGLPNRGVY